MGIGGAQLKALELAMGLQPIPANLDTVALETNVEAARWAFTQWELRTRARTKFERADEMLFTREALEQATHELVAAYHASRFPTGELVADLTTSIGADLIAFAARGPAVGFELDLERAEYATWNVASTSTLASRRYAAEVRIQDCLSFDWNFNYAFADPARRVEGRRTLNPDDFAPSPIELARRMGSLRLGGIKLSPLLSDDFLECLGPGLEFVSFGGECREALVWLGSEATSGRWALHVESGERLTSNDDSRTAVTQPSIHFYEADPAAIRAHCLGTLCQQFGLQLLGDSNGYLTGVGLHMSPWLKTYRVLYHGKADLKATREALRSLVADLPEIKQRGAGMDLPKLRKELRSYGKRKVYLAIWPIERSLQHTILEGSVSDIGFEHRSQNT